MITLEHLSISAIPAQRKSKHQLVTASLAVNEGHEREGEKEREREREREREGERRERVIGICCLNPPHTSKARQTL